MTSKSQSAGYLRLMRPVNCLMMGFAVVVGAALASPGALGEHWQSLGYGFVTGFTLTAASMIINDYYDRDIDAVNEPGRPIPSGLVKPRNALIFASVLTVIGFSAAYLTNLYCLLSAVAAWAMFAAYTMVGKRSGLPGNLLVSACVAVPFVHGSLLISGAVESNVLIFVSIVFFANTGREITKGIVDIEGDRRQQVKTLAVWYGERGAGFAAALFFVLGVALSPIPWLLNVVSLWYVPFVIVTDVGLLFSSFMILRTCSGEKARESARKVKRVVLLWFLMGLLAFVFGALR